MHARINRKLSRGFTLIELLVVTAILTIVLSGIVAVFLGSMKAVRQGYRHMDAYEMTRGAFRVIERDLTGGFTSRDNGDYYQFYGTPYGMTFVGVASNFQGIGNNQGDNLCRVSYVIRQIGDPDHPELDTIQAEDGEQPVFVLIRYVERGIDSLDNYPFGWTSDWWETNYPGSTTDPEFSGQVNQIVAELDQVKNENVAMALEVQERLINAKKRELWLRMLRGNGPVWTYDVINAKWNSVEIDNAVPPFFEFINTTKNASDYIVATNIYLYDPKADPNVEKAQQIKAATGLENFGIYAFCYGFPYSYNIAAARPTSVAPTLPEDKFGQHGLVYVNFWNSYSVQGLPNFTDSFGGEGSPLLPRLPAAVHTRICIKFAAPNVAGAEIQRVLDETIDMPSAYWRAQLGLN